MRVRRYAFLALALASSFGCSKDDRPLGTAPDETTSAPSATGPAVASTGDVKSYSTGGSVSSLGHGLEYRFLIRDPSYDTSDFISAWSATPSIEHTWDAAGTYFVKAQARCSIHNQVVSPWSTELSVTVNPTGAIVLLSGSVILTSSPEASLLPLTLQAVNGTWDESSLTWESMPSLSDSISGSQYDECFSVGCGYQATFPIPIALLKSWLDHSANNYGLAFKPGSTASGEIHFADRNGYFVPYVHLVWQYQGESLQRSRIIAISQDVYTSEALPTVNFNSIGELACSRDSGNEMWSFVKFPLSLP